MKIEDGVDVEENLVDNVAGNHSLLLQGLLQVVQILQVLDVFSFGIDKFLDDVISIGHFGAGAGLRRLAIGIGLQLKEVSTLFRKVKNVVNDLGNLLVVRRLKKKDREMSGNWCRTRHYALKTHTSCSTSILGKRYTYLDKTARVVAH